jgi:hypothetical protein
MAAAGQTNPRLAWMTFLLLAVAGLFYVKWRPYYFRAFAAAANRFNSPPAEVLRSMQQ